MHAINKLDCWTKLYVQFKEQSESNPWYAVPKLEKTEEIFKEIINEDVEPYTVQIIVEPNKVCLGKKLTMKLTFRGNEIMIPTMGLEIGKESKNVVTLNLGHNPELF